jgi:hypothetical protein
MSDDGPPEEIDEEERHVIDLLMELEKAGHAPVN